MEQFQSEIVLILAGFAHMVRLRLPIATFALLLSLLIFPSVEPSLSFAADSPHNSVNGIDCTNCHDALKSAATPTWWTDQESNVCGTCHNTLSKSGDDVMTHRNISGVLVQCTMCHDPHRQQQNRTWKASSYLYTGTSDLVTGITRTTLTSSAANWSPDQWKNMLLIPNVLAPAYNYKIASNSAKTIYIDTNGLPPSNEIDSSSIQPGNTFAIVWGRYVKANVGGRLVKFFRETGTNSFVDSDATIDGVCQVCHTKTTSFKNNGTLEGPGHPVSQTGKKCSGCHDHQAGFKANCKDCHGTPPTVDTLGGPDGLAKGNSDNGPGSTSAGAHKKHAVDRGYSCETCHTGGMPESAIRDNKQIQIGFNIAGGTFKAGIYDGRTTLANGYTYSAGNAGTMITQTGSATCSTVYCHTNGTAVATGIIPVVSSPSWSTGTIDSCSGCHGFPPSYANTNPKANSHASHNYSCENCHYNTTTTGNSITDQSYHINASYDLAPGPGRSFSYSFSFPKGTCSTVSCHSNTGTSWGASACLDCHSTGLGGRAAIKGQFDANSHHVQGVAVIDGRHCYRCHWEAKADGSINPDFHGGSASPGSPVDLVIYGAGTRPDTYSSATATQYTPNGDRLQIGRITTHCLGCHSNQNDTTDPFGDGKTPKQYSWNNTSVELRYASTGTTRWGKYDSSAYPNVETKYDLVKSYSAHGNASTNEQGWNSKGNTWETKAAATGVIYMGGSLASAGNYVYALSGGNTRNFYRYSITDDSWTPKALAPGYIYYGGALVYAGGDFLYALPGNATSEFYRYSISGDSWTSMTAAPGGIYYGGGLVYPGSGDYIYALAGTGTTIFYRYTISQNTWTSMTGTPGPIGYGGALTSASGYIYAFAGNVSTAFYRYSITDNAWTTMAASPAYVYDGGALVYPGQGNFIYALTAYYNNLLYRYSISGNSWTKMAYSPGIIGPGGALAYPGSGNYLYATGGGNTTAFYRYFFGQWTDKTGTVRVECFDCHNSHGSNAGAASDDRTTSYTSAVGGVKGGILKDTALSPSGYSNSYTPAFGGSDLNKNLYKAGAALCFDCHLTATAATKPWGYQDTFGAAQKIMSYWDTENFGPGMFGSQERFPYKTGTGHAGGHFGKSRDMNTIPAGTISGLCTPCHDPHGIDPSSANPQYKVPLLKGTWVTSPYKEDAAPADNNRESVNQANAGDVYHIDQNTFGSDVRTNVPGITETYDQFAGLCLQCHPKTGPAGIDPDTSSTWKSMDRVHETVKGWGANTKHNYICSKCHTAHNSRLPKLLVTNCFNPSHKGRMVFNASPVISSSGYNECRGGSRCDGATGSGTGHFPGSGAGSGSGYAGSGSWSRTVTCHESQSADQSWNSVTQW